MKKQSRLSSGTSNTINNRWSPTQIFQKFNSAMLLVEPIEALLSLSSYKINHSMVKNYNQIRGCLVIWQLNIQPPCLLNRLNSFEICPNLTKQKFRPVWPPPNLLTNNKTRLTKNSQLILFISSSSSRTAQARWRSKQSIWFKVQTKLAKVSMIGDASLVWM